MHGLVYAFGLCIYSEVDFIIGPASFDICYRLLVHQLPFFTHCAVCVLFPLRLLRLGSAQFLRAFARFIAFL